MSAHVREEPAAPCVLCGYPSQVVACEANHRACYRCYAAYWSALTKLTAMTAPDDAGGAGASTPALVFCPAKDCFYSAAPPGDRPDPGKAALTQLREGTAEFERATARFHETIGARATVERVFRVENPTLADMFELCRARMTQETRDTTERVMFHGTDRAAAGSIVRSGFDIRYSGKNAEALGPGIYLAENASYSHSFAVEDYGGNLCMVVARVLPGRTPEAGRRAAKRGARQREGANYYDSNTSGNILAVRREQQALPVYIIYYHV